MIIQSTLQYHVWLWHGSVFIQRCHFRCFVSLMASIGVTICSTNHLLWIQYIKPFTGLLCCLIDISVLWEHQFKSPCNHSQYPIPTDYNTNSVLRLEFIFQPQQQTDCPLFNTAESTIQALTALLNNMHYRNWIKPS